MKTLQEIKDEYAGEQGCDSWDEFFKYCELIHSRLDTMQYHHDEIAKRFAIEVAKEALRNASEKGLKKFIGQGYLLHDELKEEIENENNIPEL